MVWVWGFHFSQHHKPMLILGAHSSHWDMPYRITRDSGTGMLLLCPLSYRRGI